MIHRDYVLRLIEQFTQALIAIVKDRKAGKHEEAFYKMQSASRQYLQTDISSLLNQTPQQLLEHFKVGTQHFNVEACIFCADLFYELALIFQSKQENEDLVQHAKITCLHLYLNAMPKENQFQTQVYKQKVNELVKEFEKEDFFVGMEDSLILYQKAMN